MFNALNALSEVRRLLRHNAEILLVGIVAQVALPVLLAIKMFHALIALSAVQQAAPTLSALAALAAWLICSQLAVIASKADGLQL